MLFKYKKKKKKESILPNMTICFNETPVCGKRAKCLIFSYNCGVILNIIKKIKERRKIKNQAKKGKKGVYDVWLVYRRPKIEKRCIFPTVVSKSSNHLLNLHMIIYFLPTQIENDHIASGFFCNSLYNFSKN